MDSNFIRVRGAKEHNLKNVDIDIPKNKFIVITGVSGSGKSSLAFDTIYAEGRRRYIESLSSYARQFESNSKPNVESITGLSPAIAIDQKTSSRNPRSTVATVTEIYDYMRVLFARIGTPYSPATGLPIQKQTASEIVDQILAMPNGTKIRVIVPIINDQKGEHRKELINLRRQGFKSVRINDSVYSIDDLPLLDKNKKHTIEAILIDIEITQPNIEAINYNISFALKIGNGCTYIEILDDSSKGITKERLLFSERFACPVSGFSLLEIEPRIFSFNSPYGACPSCDGLGIESYFADDLIIVNPSISLNSGAIPILHMHSDNKLWTTSEQRFWKQTLEGLSHYYDFSLDEPLSSISESTKKVILYGSQDLITFDYSEGYKKNRVKAAFEGLIPNLEQKRKKTESNYIIEELENYRSTRSCTTCEGYRLKRESLCVKIAGKHIGEICAMSIEKAHGWFSELEQKLTPNQRMIAHAAVSEVNKRLSFFQNIGLSYLTLARRSATLSGGESQRIRLATQIGSGLSGVLYVLDEPSIGLHQADNDLLLNMLKNLRDIGNTVIVVEHDEDTMRAADYLIDVGPGAGIHGGQIVSQGSTEEVKADEQSLTGKYISGILKIEVPKKRRLLNQNTCIEIIGARANNLQNISAKIPIGGFIAVTGVSGSGKSTFTIQTLYHYAAKKLHNTKVIPAECDSILGLEHIDKVIEVDQSPIGRTPRSNPATYINAFTSIRDWFAELPEAKNRGYNASRFSFNVKGGRCEACEGDGSIKIEMHFLPDIYIGCEECRGQRYNQETLQIKHNDKSIADVLYMTADDAAKFFKDSPIIHEKLASLQDVGLGYIQIGQSATTLSGGEAQRIKLARELSRKCTGRTLYILDEPTTGLHSHDISKLLGVLHKLVDNGNTVVVIEHNLDLIKTADYLIDFGPRGGDKGGQIVTYGTPEEVARCDQSITGRYLRKYL